MLTLCSAKMALVALYIIVLPNLIQEEIVSKTRIQNLVSAAIQPPPGVLLLALVGPLLVPGGRNKPVAPRVQRANRAMTPTIQAMRYMAHHNIANAKTRVLIPQTSSKVTDSSEDEKRGGAVAARGAGRDESRDSRKSPARSEEESDSRSDKKYSDRSRQSERSGRRSGDDSPRSGRQGGDTHSSRSPRSDSRSRSRSPSRSRSRSPSSRSRERTDSEEHSDSQTHSSDRL